MSRVPFDIQFLIESILAESPNGVKLYCKKSIGSDYSAQADAAMPVLEGHIKLKNILRLDYHS